MGQFRDDLNLEKKFYTQIFKPWLNSRGNDSVFIRFNAGSVVYESLQKKRDIDVILDNGRANVSLSLKTQRKKWPSIFFETISNCNKNTPGWGFYSAADWIIYSMGDFENGFVCRCFKLSAIQNPKNYPKGYGKTRSTTGQILYKTEGRLIPWEDFQHNLLFRFPEETHA